jgi:hypothetical protein
MRYVLAFFLPWLSLILQGKIGSGIICLILQITIIGWIASPIHYVRVLLVFGLLHPLTECMQIAEQQRLLKK